MDGDMLLVDVAHTWHLQTQLLPCMYLCGTRGRELFVIALHIPFLISTAILQMAQTCIQIRLRKPGSLNGHSTNPLSFRLMITRRDWTEW